MNEPKVTRFPAVLVSPPSWWTCPQQWGTGSQLPTSVALRPPLVSTAVTSIINIISLSLHPGAANSEKITQAPPTIKQNKRIRKGHVWGVSFLFNMFYFIVGLCNRILFRDFELPPTPTLITPAEKKPTLWHVMLLESSPGDPGAETESYKPFRSTF